MPPMRYLLTSLLALSGVYAKQKDRLEATLFSKGNCDGHPISGLEEFKRDKCYSFSADNINFHAHHNPKYDRWHWKQCAVKVFGGYGCHLDDYEKSVPVPGKFEKCIPLDSAVSSVMFVCHLILRDQDGASNHTLELPAASKSVKLDRRNDDYEHTLTVTATQHSDPEANFLVRAEPTSNAILETRKEHNVKGVWMLHPWAGSAICYKCWTRKEWDFSKFRCRSGPKYYVDCGPKPSRLPHTSSRTVTTTSTSTSTVQFFFTTVNQFGAAWTVGDAAPSPNLDKRSKHKAVVFKHPYINDKVCADAEWENEGKKKAEIRLQHIKPYAKCMDRDAVEINFDQPLHTQTYTTTATATNKITTTLTTQPKWAATPGV